MSPEKIPVEKLYQKNLSEINSMQVDQMKNPEVNTGWTAEKAQRFREIIEENPGLIKEFNQNPERVRQFIAEALKKSKEVEH